VLPTPCGLFTPPPTLVPVVPCMPVVGETVLVPDVSPCQAEVPGDPPVAPLDDAPEPPPCANAKEEPKTRTDASANAVTFMVALSKARAKATDTLSGCSKPVQDHDPKRSTRLWNRDDARRHSSAATQVLHLSAHTALMERSHGDRALTLRPIACR
jgi:hypothetical protein